jgi:hypothetical protein
VKSDKALTPDPESANLLANKILDVSAEKPAAVGAPPDLAATISGKVYRFPPNAINMKSLSLTLTDRKARYDMEIYAKDETQSGLRITGPIGLDGRYRKREPSYLQESAIYGVTAVKGTWENDHAFVIDRLIIGEGATSCAMDLTFDRKKLNIRTKLDNGQEVSVDSEIVVKFFRNCPEFRMALQPFLLVVSSSTAAITSSRPKKVIVIDSSSGTELVSTQHNCRVG